MSLNPEGTDPPGEKALEDAVRRAADLVASAASVAVLTGAGISTDAGIPDFRGPEGLWTRDPAAERRSTLRDYLDDPEVRRAAWRHRLDSPVWSAHPTVAHRALVDLERGGRLHTLVTQNTDGLHILAGSAPELVVEIHGNAHVCVCWECGDRQPTKAVLARVGDGDDDPRCRRLRRLDDRGDPAMCGGILKTATVSFGQSIEPRDLERARLAATRAEVLLVIGTTLEVQPVAGMASLAHALGKPVVIVNGSPTAGDSLAAVIVRGSISRVVPRIVAGG